LGAEPGDDDEAAARGRRATLVLVWLGLATVASGVGIAVVLRPEAEMSAQRLTLASLMAGALGAGLVALVAVADRTAGAGAANGAGTAGDTAYGGAPAGGASPGMTRGVVPLYAIRPLLGAGAGLLAYTGLAGVLLFASGTGAEQPRTESVLFLAILAGLFSKALVDHLKGALDAYASRR
jgi:hypothetical protein